MCVGGEGLNCVRGGSSVCGEGGGVKERVRGASLCLYIPFMDVMYICMHVC